MLIIIIINSSSDKAAIAMSTTGWDPWNDIFEPSIEIVRVNINHWAWFISFLLSLAYFFFLKQT